MPTKFGPWKSGPGRAPFTYSYQGTSSTGEFNCYLTNLTSSIILVILVLHQDFVKNLVTDGLGVELNNKVNEMNLILANHISDKVIDDVIDNLSR